MGGRVVVVGGGALGSLLAAKLSAGSAKVSILPSRSPEKCRVLAEQGIRVEGLSSVHAFVDVLCAPRALPADTSAVLLAIKDVGRGVEDVAARLASPNFVPDAAVVVSCMNGIRALGVLERHGLSTDRTAAMVSALGATLLDTGRVRHVGNGPSYLGTHSSSPRTREALARLTETLRASGFPVEVLGSEQELDRALWRKLAVNAAINPLTALHGVLNGEVLARADLADLARQLCEEVAVVAAASGRRLTAQEAWAAVTEAAERTAGNRSSMLQDMKGGRPLELQAINGAVVEEAEASGVGDQVPVNRRIIDLVTQAAASRN